MVDIARLNQRDMEIGFKTLNCVTNFYHFAMYLLENGNEMVNLYSLY